MSVPLAPGRGSPPAAARLTAAVRLARRFARAWAVAVYRRRPPRLPGETAAVARELAAAATRVPPTWRRLRARLLGLRFRPGGPRRVLASAGFGDGRFPPFSVGFVLTDRGDRWVVTSISPPD